MTDGLDGMYFFNNAANASLLYESGQGSDSIKVYEDDQYRWLKLGDKTIQSAMSLAEPWRAQLPYYPALLSALLFNHHPQSILMLGLGGGELVRNLRHCMPDIKLVAVEKSAAMIEVFHNWFNPESQPLTTINADVCEWQGSDHGTYDMAFLDVYSDRALPECMYEDTLYSRLFHHLGENGILAVNLVVKDDQEAVLLLARIRKIFNQQTLCVAVDGHNNLVVLAFRKMPDKLQQVMLQDQAVSVYEKAGFAARPIVENICKHNPNV